MSWHPPSIDTTHGMYEREHKPKRSPFRVLPSEVDPRAQGSQQEREQWMRDRQEAKDERRQVKRAFEREDSRDFAPRDENRRMAEVEGQREAQLIAEAESEIRHRRAAERID